MTMSDERKSSKNERRVSRRRVFYIPGYDPNHPRRYRELYRKEGALQAAISGYQIVLNHSKSEHGCFSWSVTGVLGGEECHTDFNVMPWSDIVRHDMEKSIVRTYLQLIRTFWVYMSTGVLFRLVRLRIAPVLVALYPIVFLILQLLLSLLLAGCIFLGGRVIGYPALGVLSAIGGGIWLLKWFKAQDKYLMVYYLMHDYAYSARFMGKNSHELEGKITTYSKKIKKIIKENNADEILIVGHSSGVHLGVSVLANILRSGLPQEHPEISFLSLGQVVPMVSFLPKAQRLRGDLLTLALSDQITWVDVSAPGDPCCFALCDPVAVSAVFSKSDVQKRWPLVISAAFKKNLSKQWYKKFKWRYFRRHVQYLCAFDKPENYDYFQITAGPMTLRQRYKKRASSKNQITIPVNHFNDI